MFGQLFGPSLFSDVFYVRICSRLYSVGPTKTSLNSLKDKKLLVMVLRLEVGLEDYLA